MNFLAHLYLSNSNENILIGNFIADAVKGRKFNDYPKEIKAGILLHREIDNYTDNHPIVKISKRRLHERYHHYDGVIIDILYDHFLAKNWKKYSEIPLKVYAKNIYTFLENNNEILPLRAQNMLPYMVEYNWLVSYASIEGIAKVLSGMNKRTKGISKMDLAVEDLQIHYLEFEEDFTMFFEDLVQFSNKKTKILLTQ
ncbi:ACP phosphodiesterase [Lutibacter sp.]|uniref:acyl carrier protein phosphodiesterase n=1 Tax=Lutibacter sp. TaxID=1925666 RepID=UPI001A2507CE|nr:ACP phosphodiesterase [Lutibacter sp.]MBI9042652.1 acyl carrier protein phosphodiesterase [Lutibacter sp.]